MCDKVYTSVAPLISIAYVYTCSGVLIVMHVPGTTEKFEKNGNKNGPARPHNCTSVHVYHQRITSGAAIT